MPCRKNTKSSSIARGLTVATAVIGGPLGSSRPQDDAERRVVVSPAVDGYTFELEGVPSMRPPRTPSPTPDYPPPPYLSSPSTSTPISSSSNWTSPVQSDSDSDIYIRTPSEDYAHSPQPMHPGQTNITMRNVFNSYESMSYADPKSKRPTRGPNANVEASIATPDWGTIPQVMTGASGILGGVGGLANANGNGPPLLNGGFNQTAADVMNAAMGISGAIGLPRPGVTVKEKKSTKKQKAQKRRRRDSSSSSSFDLSDLLDSSDSDSSLASDDDSSSTDDEEIRALEKELKKLESKNKASKATARKSSKSSSSSKRSSEFVGSSTGRKREPEPEKCRRDDAPHSKHQSLWEAEHAKANVLRARSRGYDDTPLAPPSYPGTAPVTMTAGRDNIMPPFLPPFLPPFSFQPMNPMASMHLRHPIFGAPPTMPTPPKPKEKTKKKKTTKTL